VSESNHQAKDVRGRKREDGDRGGTQLLASPKLKRVGTGRDILGLNLAERVTLGRRGTVTRKEKKGESGQHGTGERSMTGLRGEKGVGVKESGGGMGTRVEHLKGEEKTN